MDLTVDTDTNVINVKIASVWWCTYRYYVAVFEVQFMKKLSKTEAEFKKIIANKKKSVIQRDFNGYNAHKF